LLTGSPAEDTAAAGVVAAAWCRRRPILAVGNSDGDQAMLEYTTINNPHPSLGVLIHHTDAEREYAYASHPTSSGKLVTALQEVGTAGWTVVDMKADWNTIFGS
jgi:hypothetical protein